MTQPTGTEAKVYDLLMNRKAQSVRDCYSSLEFRERLERSLQASIDLAVTVMRAIEDIEEAEAYVDQEIELDRLQAVLVRQVPKE